MMGFEILPEVFNNGNEGSTFFKRCSPYALVFFVSHVHLVMQLLFSSIALQGTDRSNNVVASGSQFSGRSRCIFAIGY